MNVEELIKQIELKEKRARKLSLVFTLIPIITAVILIYFTSSKVINAQNELNSIENELETVEVELIKTKESNDLLQIKIDQIEDFMDQIVKFDWSDEKIFFSLTRNRKVQNLFLTILRMKEREIPWDIGGYDPSTGFDSPSFATFVLVHGDIISPSLKSQRYNLQNNLKAIAEDELKTGDLIIYKTGYTMFYMEFRDKEYKRRKVILGMTPAGIRVLEMDFSDVAGYYQIPVEGDR